MDDERASAPVRDHPGDRLTATALYRAVLLAFALFVLIQVFPVLAGLLLLVLLVVIVAVPVSGATTRLERLHVPRAVGAPLVLLTVVAVLGGLIALLVPTFVSEVNRLVDVLPSTIDSLRRNLSRATHAPPSQAGSNVQRFVSGYVSHPSRLLGPATTVGAGAAGVLTGLIVVALTALYSSIQSESLVRGVVRLFPPPKRAHARHIMHRLATAYLGWLKGLAIGMAVLWIITYVGLTAIGLPFAVVFATLTAVAMVIPYYGALVSAIPPVLLAVTISPGKALLVAALYVLSHQVEGNLIEPIVMSRAVDLHPALVAVGVVAMERLFGFLGLVVAVPILVTIKILVEELWVRPLELTDHGRDPPDELLVGPSPRSGVPRAARFLRKRATRRSR
jgi:predicted PurR-regulated permease PerM